MMPATWQPYAAHLLDHYGPNRDHRVDWVGDEIRVLLTGAGYKPNVNTDSVRADVTHELKGTGYEEGGLLVGGRALAYTDGRVVLKAGDAVWGPGATLDGVKAAVLYKATGDRKTDPLIAVAVADRALDVWNGTLLLDVAPSGALLTIEATKGQT